MKEFSKDHFNGLKDLYINENKTIKKCAEHYGCSAKTISNKLNEFKITKFDDMTCRQNIFMLNGLKKFYNDGNNVKVCAEHYGCSVSTIRSRLKILGVEFIKERNDIDEKNIMELYTSGKSLEHCADVFKCSVVSIRSRLIKNGVKIHSRNSAKRLIGLEDMYKETGSMQACADHFKCSIFHIHKRLKDLGLD